MQPAGGRVLRDIIQVQLAFSLFDGANGSVAHYGLELANLNAANGLRLLQRRCSAAVVHGRGVVVTDLGLEERILFVLLQII